MRSLRFLLVLLFAVTACAALVLADAGPLGQNANSSTTEDSAQNDNANMTPRPRRGRRGRRRAPAQAMTDTAVAAPAAQDDDSRGDLSGEQVDLSGTYTGNLSTTGGSDVGNGQSTLTITGNTFTLESGGTTHNGRIYAVLTRGEVSAALYFPDITVGTPPTPAVYNVRARKRGDHLTLWPAPRTAARLWFGSGRGRR